MGTCHLITIVVQFRVTEPLGGQMWGPRLVLKWPLPARPWSPSLVFVFVPAALGVFSCMSVLLGQGPTNLEYTLIRGGGTGLD